MVGARPPRREPDDRGGVAAWLVLDLVHAGPPAEPAELDEALGELSQAVRGITVLAHPEAEPPPHEAVTVLRPEAAGSAARLRQAEVAAPAEVDVVVYGGEQLLAADYRCSVADALALFTDRDVALVRGVPVTDSLRRVDERDRLRGCVERDQLFELQNPQVIRREAVAHLADLAAADGADGSVASGLLRFPWPVRVVDIYPTATHRSETHPVPTRS